MGQEVLIGGKILGFVRGRLSLVRLWDEESVRGAGGCEEGKIWSATIYRSFYSAVLDAGFCHSPSTMFQT